MNLPQNVAPKPSALASPVVELRQYTLKPGQRDTLIDIFDGRLIEGQEAAGMTIIGQFRDLDRPDMFVWMRGFDGMAARKNALAAFYGGPVWAAHRDAANATMIDSDDVLLLKPAWPGAGFDLAGAQRPNLAGDEKPIRNRPLAGIVVIEIHHLQPGTEADFTTRFEIETACLMTADARLLAAFVTEPAENNFPRLPVRADENVFISVMGFASTEAHARHKAALAASPAWQDFWRAAQPGLTKPTETLRLSPTSQSLVGIYS
ncbi:MULTISPECIES: NIPSNAP family protein [unclassified Mesorhizobium]|uniref:NIPSNAP family protein n=1 Tax=unclassified Mesorhizobium TaxID=325217 RepID=UPI000FC99EA3|nr:MULTISPECIES: NIPSNAP family protein [unclassified Mesorhizobium]RUZ20078.1 NIPSNAP family protein [Mesorhizobium sp. M7A.F.Ca.US.007.01.2.1]RUZ46657.1 NIPSNAP family protein [Mesorhizobium sp. M7A.F.Ca.US.003.02.1.1]RUZ61996.1 NIPSNAP family protein [Mesorhizobium sp. M7A.F.Ca.US.007.01.1.1]